MNNRIACLTVFLGIIMTFCQSTVKAQCNSDEIVESCISELDTNFHYLKSYQLEGRSGDESVVEHSYVLTKNTEYLIKLCTKADSTMDIAINIFDSNRRNVSSSSSDSTMNSSLKFDCKVTGIYYLQYTFINSEEYCGGSAIGFKSD